MILVSAKVLLVLTLDYGTSDSGLTIIESGSDVKYYLYIIFIT